MTTAPEPTFRNAMRRLASTVSIVSCADARGWHGMTATAVASVCADPPTLLVCVNATSSVYAPLIAESRFCVNLLRSTQAHLSQVFAGKLDGQERFTEGSWLAEEGGLPYLADAQANLFCTVDRVVPYGTHGIFIGRVDAVRIAEDVSPLIYQDGHYAATVALPEKG